MSRSLKLKRVMDVAGAILGLVLFAPVMLFAAILIRWRMGSPVLFVQERPGLHGRIFRMIKFRTMNNAMGATGELLPDKVRLTRLGGWMRRLSIDELPQLVNVLHGEMSLVGPRPLLVEYLPLYSQEQARRHDMRPGITGWAQINGRNAIAWGDKFTEDLWYIDNWSLQLDVWILLLTLGRVFRRKGISAESHVTMPKFEGTTPVNHPPTASAGKNSLS
jgi:lipopolysaccharide/colanic/teichoic acid biosynthesis glycosyltransferase